MNSHQQAPFTRRIVPSISVLLDKCQVVTETAVSTILVRSPDVDAVDAIPVFGVDQVSIRLVSGPVPAKTCGHRMILKGAFMQVLGPFLPFSIVAVAAFDHPDHSPICSGSLGSKSLITGLFPGVFFSILQFLLHSPDLRFPVVANGLIIRTFLVFQNIDMKCSSVFLQATPLQRIACRNGWLKLRFFQRNTCQKPQRSDGGRSIRWPSLFSSCDLLNRLSGLNSRESAVRAKFRSSSPCPVFFLHPGSGCNSVFQNLQQLQVLDLRQTIVTQNAANRSLSSVLVNIALFTKQT